jgi:2-keto-4-pentenoate hydratase
MNNESPARSPIEDVPATVMTKLTAVSTASVACRSALVKSPAASRAALAKHHASIDPALAKALEVVGGYTNEVTDTSSTFSSFCFHVLLPFMHL